MWWVRSGARSPLTDSDGSRPSQRDACPCVGGFGVLRGVSLTCGQVLRGRVPIGAGTEGRTSVKADQFRPPSLSVMIVGSAHLPFQRDVFAARGGMIADVIEFHRRELGRQMCEICCPVPFSRCSRTVGKFFPRRSCLFAFRASSLVRQGNGTVPRGGNHD